MSFIWIVAGDRFVEFDRLNFDGNIQVYFYDFLLMDLEHNVCQMGNWVQLRLSPR